MFNDLTFIRQWFEFVTRSLRHTNYRTDAVTGKLDGSGNLIVDATQGLPPNYVWVRLGDNRTAVPMLSKVRAVAGVDVVVAYDRLWREDVVLEVNLTRTQLDYAAAYNVPMLPANMSTPVSARDIVPGGVFADASGGLYVRVGAYWHEANYWPDSAPLALTPTATSSKKSLAVVGVDRATNTLTYTLTADRTLATNLIINAAPTTFASADIQAVIDADPTVDWRGAVELAHGDTEVDPTKIIALLWQKPTMVGADGSTAGIAGLVPAPAATDDTKYLRGDGSYATPSSTSIVLTTKGDLLTRSSSGEVRLPVGSNGAVLTADSSETSGIKWASLGGGSLSHTYLGYNTAGGSTETMTRYRQLMKKITAPSDGVILNVGAYVKPSASANVMGFSVAVLADNAGNPDEIISLVPWHAVYSALLDNSFRWVSIPMSLWVTAGDYWIAISDIGSGSRLQIAYDSGSDKYWSTGNPWMTGADGGYSLTAASREYSLRAGFLT